MTKLVVTAQAGGKLLQLAKSSAPAYVETVAKLKALQRVAAFPYGFAGEFKIGVINHRYGVYIVYPTAPGAAGLVVYDPNPADEMTVTDLPDLRQMRTTRALVADAAAAIGVTPSDVQLSP